MRVILVIALVIGSCTAYAGSKDTVKDVYKGVLPCADCSGISTTLTLRHDHYADDGLFILEEIYQGGKGGNKRSEIKGDWTVLRGDAVDENAVVIELTDSKTNKALRHYLRLSGGKIKMLDDKLSVIKTKGNYILRKN